MASQLAKIIADFQTQLATELTVGGTSATLQSAIDDDGVSLPSGRYFFTIDGDNSQKEHIACTLSGTSLTSIKTVSRQGIETSGVLRKHRVGATVTITDFKHIKAINDLLDGTTNLDASTPLGYDGTASITTANQLATKAYVDGVAIAGAPDASTTVKGISKLSTAPASPTDPIAVGTNDTRMPTQGENDALAGSSGTPSSTNKYITEDDVAENTNSKVVRRKSDGNVTVPSTPTSNTDAASKNYIDTTISNTVRPIFTQPIVIPSGSGTAFSPVITTAATGVSTTEPFFAISGGSTSTPIISRYLKLLDGSIIQTHQVTATSISSGNNGFMCVLGSHLYVLGNNGGTIQIRRYNKDDLTNATLMTISGTGILNSAIFSDGTKIYNISTSGGSAREYTLSGTTLTSGSSITYTNMQDQQTTWSNGTKVYQFESLNTVFSWPIAGTTRTTEKTGIPTSQFNVGNGALFSGGGGVFQENTTNTLYVIGTENGGPDLVGKIIPVV